MYFIRKIYHFYDWYFRGGKKRSKINAEKRKANQMHSYDYPSENNGWKKYGDYPIIGNTCTGTIFDPYVFYHKNKFYMVASARKDGSLKLLSSLDGIKWTFEATILKRKRFSWENQVNRGCLLNVDGIWHLWYTGQNKGVSKIGHLKSNDLKTFIRVGVNKPVLVPDAIQEATNVMNPCVIYDNAKKIYRMWYAAGEFVEPDCIFYAESKDGENWIKRNEPVLTKYEKHIWEQAKIGGCDVKLLDNDKYIMYYIGYQNLDVARICYALSNDGILWERPENNLCLSPTEDSWDCHATYKPAVINNGGKLYMWYNGRNCHEEYIGLAIKEYGTI